MPSDSQPRILVAGLFHETHTFVEGTTGPDDFVTRSGEALLEYEGDASPMGGALEAGRRLGWSILPAVDMRASPSGMVQHEVVEHWWTQFCKVARPALEAGVEGIYLVLHGAMVTAEWDDVEGLLLSRIRALPGAGSIPVFGVFDLHANFTAEMARQADCLVAYRENPHTDGRLMAVRAAELLDRAVRQTERPRQYWRHAGIIWPPTGTATALTPMGELEARARKLEAEHTAVWNVSVIAGFSFADTPDAGVGFCIATTGAEEEAEAALEDLCSLAWDLREFGCATDAPAGEVVAAAVRLADEKPGRPVVIAEPSDNIGGGAPGDGTGLLRVFLEQDVQDAAVCLYDPEAVAALANTPLGEERVLALGGRGSRLDAGPLHLAVTLVSRGAGLFALEDRQSHLASMCGDRFDMGACAVVRHRGVVILLTSNRTPPFDLAQWRSQGIAPESLRVIGVKAAVAHRRAYEGIAAAMLSADTPGPCRSDVTKMPYRHVRPGVYPISNSSCK
jgi:microcystin degradation protein MlrC